MSFTSQFLYTQFLTIGCQINNKSPLTHHNCLNLLSPPLSRLCNSLICDISYVGVETYFDLFQPKPVRFTVFDKNIDKIINKVEREIEGLIGIDGEEGSDTERGWF